MSSDKRLETLYAHYNDVVGDRRNRIRYRNRYLFLILIIIVLILVQDLHPKLVLDILVGVAARFSGAKPPDTFPILEPILLFAYMLVVLRYLQISVGIERSYGVSNRLEKELKCTFGVPINTEGEGYAKNYPVILNLFDVLYKLLIPIVLLCVAMLPILHKVPSVVENVIQLDTLTLSSGVFVVVFVLFYLWFTYSGFVKRASERIHRKIHKVSSNQGDSASTAV